MTTVKLLILALLGAALIHLPGRLFAKNNEYHRVHNNSSIVKGSGDLITQTRTTGAFTRIETNLGIDLKVEVGKEQSIAITFDDNLIGFIRTDADARTLTIDSDESFSTRNDVQVVVTVPQLELVNSQGSGTIDIVNISSKRFRAIISGSGELTATGKTEQLEIEINGSGDVRTDELAAREVTVVINGSGSAEVNALEMLEGEINGSGDILYVGKPENIHSSVNGSGSIRKRK
ncbi:MAG: head GIN domain-containing protein [Candidatus Zixiibacteriota bacterium]